MKKFLSLAMLAVMVFCVCASATAANDLTGRMEEMRAIRTQIWTLMSKPMPTAEDRAQLETLKQEYDAKRQGTTTPATAQEESSIAIEQPKAPSCSVCPAANAACQPKIDETKCACECSCCKAGNCIAKKACCEKCCCSADKSCCKMDKCNADKTCCKDAGKDCMKRGKKAHKCKKGKRNCPKSAPAATK